VHWQCHLGLCQWDCAQSAVKGKGGVQTIKGLYILANGVSGVFVWLIKPLTNKHGILKAVIKMHVHPFPTSILTVVKVFGSTRASLMGSNKTNRPSPPEMSDIIMEIGVGPARWI